MEASSTVVCISIDSGFVGIPFGIWFHGVIGKSPIARTVHELYFSSFYTPPEYVKSSDRGFVFQHLMYMKLCGFN